MGPWIVLGLVPYPLILLLDSLGWRELFHRKDRPSLGALFGARLVAESVSQCVPSGGMAGEVVTVWRIRGPGRSIGPVTGTIVLRRILLALGHGLTLALAAAVSAAGISSWTRSGHAALLASASAALLTLALGGASLARAGPASRLPGALARLPLPPVFRDRLAAQALVLAEADRGLARFFAGPARRRRAPAALFFLVFLGESAETWLLLRLLGCSLSFADVLSFEALLSLVRALAVFVPAGLGVQDAGYLGALSLAGVPHAASVGAAFVLLKRGKEALWATAGLLLLAPRRRGGRSPREGEDDGIAADPLHRGLPQPDLTDAPDRARAPRP